MNYPSLMHAVLVVLAVIFISSRPAECEAETILGRVDFTGSGTDLSSFQYQDLEASRGATTILFDLTLNGDFRFDFNEAAGANVLALNSDDPRIDSFVIDAISDDNPAMNYRLQRLLGVTLLDASANGQPAEGEYTNNSPTSPLIGPTRPFSIPDNSILFVGLDQATTLALSVEGSTANRSEVQVLSLEFVFEGSAVPEPSSGILSLLAAFAFSLKRRRSA